jgi:membrane-bound serine protease (ClpP class)
LFSLFRNRIFELGPVISGEGKLLTLTAGSMEKYGISQGTVATREDLITLLGLEMKDVTVMEESRSDKLVALITGGVVTSLLIMIGLVAVYLEISSPGFGFPGTAAIIVFSIVFLGGALMGTMDSLELLLFILGVILLAVEVFLIPGFGVTGIMGLVLMSAGLILSRQDFIIPDFDWQVDVFLRNLMIVMAAIVGSGGLIALIMAFFPRLPLFNRLILTTPADVSKELFPQKEETPEEIIGTALTDLRPAGKARFGLEVLPVESDGEYIPAGERVRITEQSGNRIKVERL